MELTLEKPVFPKLIIKIFFIRLIYYIHNEAHNLKKRFAKSFVAFIIG